MKNNKFLEKNNLVSLLEYKLEYRQELKRLDNQAKREVEKSLLFMGM